MILKKGGMFMKRLKFVLGLLALSVLCYLLIVVLVQNIDNQKEINNDNQIVNEIKSLVVSETQDYAANTKNTIDIAKKETLETLDSSIVSDFDTDIDSEIVSDTDIDLNFNRQIDFNLLQSINSDVYCWLYIPNTNIDSYVLKEQNVGEYYYGTRDIYGRSNATGSFFIPAIPCDMPDAHLLILGHRMNNGSMFGNLPAYYANVDSAFSYPYIYLYYPDRVERWKMWIACDAESDDMLYAVPYTLGADDYNAMLDHAVDISRYMLDDRPDSNTPTIFLSTCNQWSDGSWGRFLVGCIPDYTFAID